VTGTADATNSLVGSNDHDEVGLVVTALANGNYVVASPTWNGGRGAATWGDGAAGVTGPVSATNSLIGTNAMEAVGYSVTPLSNGNYVVRSPYWSGSRGAATWGDGTQGVTGTVDATNSLVGSSPNDYVALHVTALSNGDYVVSTPDWNGWRGAATWGDGAAGVTGTVDASNSLVGGSPDDEVGLGVTPLSNGHYVVASPNWNAGGAPRHGAATWGNGSAGVTGTIDDTNSLVGSRAGDQVGLGVTALANGNYVVSSPLWNGLRGAATWGNGTAGITGATDARNSLVGSNAGDQVSSGSPGFGGVTALANGNYVVLSPQWNGQRGAATWGDGTAGITGTIDPSNSLVG
jgi:hypothetical protein